MTIENITHIPSVMMAPCGMNCGICSAHLRDKNRCVGCNIDLPQKVNHCFTCSIKNCDQKPGGSSFCFDCKQYPCARLKQLDKRYVTKYGMSMLDNLDKIKKFGIKKFMRAENTRWVCGECGSPISIHNKKCYSCGKQYPPYRFKPNRVLSN